MQITQTACEFVKTSPFKDTVIVIFEQEYTGWCGVKKVTSVAPAEREQVIRPENYIEKGLENCPYPILVHEHLTHLWDQAKIDLVGWAAFKRLTIIPESSQKNEICL